MSDLKTSTDIGYNGTVAMAINLPFIPVGLRVDGAYNQFGQKAGVPAKLHVASATGNVVWRLPSVGISPYLIGGAGLYMATATVTGSPSQTDNHLGWNAGAGINLRCRYSMRSSRRVIIASRPRAARWSSFRLRSESCSKLFGSNVEPRSKKKGKG